MMIMEMKVSRLVKDPTAMACWLLTLSVQLKVYYWIVIPGSFAQDIRYKVRRNTRSLMIIVFVMKKLKE